MKTIKETTLYRVEQDDLGNTRIVDLTNNCTSTWYTDERARNQINLIKNFFNDEEFNDYCKRALETFR